MFQFSVWFLSVSCYFRAVVCTQTNLAIVTFAKPAAGESLHYFVFVHWCRVNEHNYEYTMMSLLIIIQSCTWQEEAAILKQQLHTLCLTELPQCLANVHPLDTLDNSNSCNSLMSIEVLRIYETSASPWLHWYYQEDDVYIQYSDVRNGPITEEIWDAQDSRTHF